VLCAYIPATYVPTFITLYFADELRKKIELYNNIRNSLKIYDGDSFTLSAGFKALYLRSFSAEAGHAQKSEEFWGSESFYVRTHSGLAVRIALSSLNELGIVYEALNLARPQAENRAFLMFNRGQWKTGPDDFIPICLYEIINWQAVIAKLCALVDLIVLHVGDVTPGLLDELAITKEFNDKCVVIVDSQLVGANQVWKTISDELASDPAPLVITYRNEMLETSGGGGDGLPHRARGEVVGTAPNIAGVEFQLSGDQLLTWIRDHLVRGAIGAPKAGRT
jgi:hypothetical protein